MASKGSGELIKSILIIGGIPLTFSVACSLYSRTKERKIASLQDQMEETKCDMIRDDDEDGIGNVDNLKEQIFNLRCKIEELQDLEREIEVRFSRFLELKDQEYALMEVQKTLCIEKERAEFLQREMSSMEEQKKKFDEMVIAYLKALEELESSRSKNSVLQRREKKLLKETKESLRLIVKQNLKIEAQEVDMLSKEVELKRKVIVIEGLEREVEVMREEIDRLQNEKNEVLNKLEITENEVASKVEAEQTLRGNYNRVANELENIKKDRAGEIKELIYLRWCHACLRHELAKRKELEQEPKHDEENVDNDVPGLEFRPIITREECMEAVLRHGPISGPGHHRTKRPWFVRKFKKWVKGNEKHHESKRFRSLSCIDEAEEQHSERRKSFSSV